MNSAGLFQVSVFGAVWRHRLLVLSATLLGALLMWGIGRIIPGSGSSEATASVVVSDSSEFAVGAADQPARFVGNQVEILRSLSVANRTLQLLEDGGFRGVTRTELLEDLRVVASENSDEIVIRYSNTDPALAIATVNSVLQAYVEINEEQTNTTAQEALDRIDAEIEVLAERVDAIAGEIRELETSDTFLSQLSSQADQAIAELQTLQTQLDLTTDLAQRATLSERLGEMRARIQLFLTAQATVASNPELQALIESQSRSIERRAALVERRDQILIDTALTPGVVAFQDPAVATTPIPGFSGGRGVAAGLVLGLIAGAAYATIRVNRQDVVSGRQQVVDLLGAPALAAVPDFRTERLPTRVPVVDNPRSVAAESYRFALTSLETALNRLGASVILIASPASGQGKTTTTANVALAASLQHDRVLAIDADFEDQDLSRLFAGAESVSETPGLTGAISRPGLHLEDVIWSASIGQPDLYMLSRGSQDMTPSSILQSEVPRKLIEQAREQFDMVIVDSPPLLRVAYTSDLMRLVDAVIAIIPSWCTVGEINEFRVRCEFMNVPIAGIIYTHDALSVDMPRSEDTGRGFFSREPESKVSSVAE